MNNCTRVRCPMQGVVECSIEECTYKTEPPRSTYGMKVNKIIISKVEERLEITGATLLSAEEAGLIPLEDRTYDKRWWLRSPGIYAYCVRMVYDDGYVSYNYDSDYDDISVRPALILKNLEKTDFQIGDVFVIRDYKFKIISDTLAWMYEDDIGCCAFREDWKAPDANVYEKSDVKKYIDKWFEELKNNVR